MAQFVIHYKSRCPHNAVWNTRYYKLRCNSTQFVMYYKLRNYYKLQRNNACIFSLITEAAIFITRNHLKHACVYVNKHQLKLYYGVNKLVTHKQSSFYIKINWVSGNWLIHGEGTKSCLFFVYPSWLVPGGLKNGRKYQRDHKKCHTRSELNCPYFL